MLKGKNRPGTNLFYERLYANRNPFELEPYYSAHVQAMTAESLRAKADIAAELAFRDKRIAELENPTSNQKLQIMRDICDVTVSCGEDEIWSCNARAEIRNGGILSGVLGRHTSKEKAIDDAWNKMTKLAPNETVVINAYGPDRKSYRWSGFHWSLIEEN